MAGTYRLAGAVAALAMAQLSACSDEDGAKPIDGGAESEMPAGPTQEPDSEPASPDMETPAQSDAPGYMPVYQDPDFSEVFIDVDEWRDEPVRHRYVHGGFKDTDARFSVYFPPAEKYEGRFFHYILPVPGNEHAVSSPEYPDPSYSIGFAVDSGAYLVESNHGALGFDATADPEISLWRASAAVAEQVRILANAYYPDFGPHRPFGYAWGGSGGAFKTIACIEYTDGVWDGVVPFIHASPIAMPNNFTVQAHAMRLLRDRIPSIVDAVEPGGSGDMYAGLDDAQRAALEEVTRMGFPPDAWFNYQSIAIGYTGVLASLLPAVQLLDKSYFDDFWAMPGYLGADHPEALEDYRIHAETTIAEVLLPEDVEAMGLPLSLSASQPSSENLPAGLLLTELPDGDLQGTSITLKSGQAMDETVTIAGVVDGVALLGFGTGAEALAGVRAGDEVLLDNSVYLAIQTYHRHQTPPPEYSVYDQYRDDSGQPLYPQRMFQATSLFNQAGMMSGKFSGKMIVVENLMDEIAFPWHADWYRARVKAQLGDAFEDNYRLWYVERGMHTPPKDRAGGLMPALTTRVVNFGPVLQQALRDVAAWVEDGTPPPASTAYEVVDGQVVVPLTAAERKGVQPVVTARANGGERAEVAVGEAVSFTAVVELPPGTGSVVAVEWDFEGGGDFPEVQALADTDSQRVELETSHIFEAPGTYFPAVRASAHRDGDPDTPYGRIPNLGRVRVVVQ